MDKKTFKLVLVGWLLAMGQTFLVVEPLEVLLLTLAPSLLAGDWCTYIRTKNKEWGFY